VTLPVRHERRRDREANAEGGSVISVIMTVAVILGAAASVCLWMVLVEDGGAGYVVGYVVLQGAAILASARARKRKIT
jgi:Tfp pilus assembly protein PilN